MLEQTKPKKADYSIIKKRSWSKNPSRFSATFPQLRPFPNDRSTGLPGSSEIQMRSSQADGINLHGQVSHATVSKVPGAFLRFFLMFWSPWTVWKYRTMWKYMNMTEYDPLQWGWTYRNMIIYVPYSNVMYKFYVMCTNIYCVSTVTMHIML